MPTELAIHLSEQAFSSLAAAAVAAGKTPAEQAAAVVENVYAGGRPELRDAETANREFEQWFGSIDLGRPIGIENASLDADLAREYGSAHGS
jgi:hypothetical protein